MRCFIAVDLPKSTEEKIKEIQKNFKISGIKLTESLHFTLKFLGEVNNLDEIKEKLSSIEYNPFEIYLRGLGAFPNEKFIRVIWIGCDSKELENLAIDIDKKMSEIGFKPETKYKSHVTIARVRGRADKKVYALLNKFKSIEIGKMIVNEIKLKQSILTPRGPIYSDIASFRF